MWRAGSQARLRAQCVTLEASVERAGRALACVYSGSKEFEAAVIRARRGRVIAGWDMIAQMQVALAATAVAAVAMLVVLFV
jgi:hypothetical protein